MTPSTPDDNAGRRTDAVQREMQRRRTADEPDEPDLVGTVGEEQRRQREAADAETDREDRG
jgi:hypothetical protein